MAGGLPVLLMGYEGSTTLTGFTSTSQQFFTFTGSLVINNYQGATEALQQTAFESAGTMSDLWCRVKTAAVGISTVRLRVNSGNGNGIVSIGSNSTGAFTDTLNTDNIAGGSLLDVGVTPGSTALVLTIIAATFTASSNTVTTIGAVDIGQPASLPTGTFFTTPIGIDSTASTLTTVEANTKNRQRKAMTIKNVSIQIAENSSSTTTFVSRKNGINGTISISVGSSSTGLFQDLTHSDSVVSGDDYDFTYTDNTGNGIFVYTNSADFVSTVGDTILSCANDALTTINTSVTAYAGLCGGLGTTQSTETNAQVTVNSAFVFSQLTCNVISPNNITGTSTITLRANAGDAGPALSIGASASGIFNDNVNTYTASPTDVMNYKVVTASTGTSMKVAFISVWGNATPGAGATGPSYHSFNNTRRQNYNSFGGQMVVFG